MRILYCIKINILCIMLDNCEKTLYIDSTFCSTELCKIGGEMNTDKSPFALNSVCCQHRKGYTAVYSLLFSRYKNKVINFAEIGIESGASLLTWNKYFSENCNIYAFEFEKHKIENCKNLNLKNINFIHTDVNNIEYLDSTFKETSIMFDIIIDDSNHIIKSQNNIINTTSKYLKSGGILIIEDINRKEHINSYNIDTDIWEFHTFIICHHNNRNCCDNDKILYLVKK
jgi:precorrin-6B methylase 2